MEQQSENLGEALKAIVGEAHVFAGEAIEERYRQDISHKYVSRPAFHVRPASTEEVAAVVKLAAAHGAPVTAIGGQTGTAGSAVPVDQGIALSFERMNRIVEIDAVSMTLTVEAGCILQVAHEAVEAEGLFLPLDLGGRGSATIGGNIGTNAGGNRVLRWGMMRDMVIGLEAVLADGTVVSSLTKMLKDNAGYNWKHLLIGSEGTLGIITRAVLRLRPLPSTRQTALLGGADFNACATVLRRLERSLSGRLSSFELMWEDFYFEMTEARISERPRPMPLGCAFYVLIEAMGGDAEGDDAQFERALTELLEEGLLSDVVIAKSERERREIWSIRDEMPGTGALRPFSAYDISMGLSDMPEFVEKARRNLKAAYPQARALFYGHAGDGNLHILCSIGAMDSDIQRTFDEAVFGAVREVHGSIAAEHGVGMSRAPFLPFTRTPEELALMRTLKAALDPKHILNPGKLLDAM